METKEVKLPQEAQEVTVIKSKPSWMAEAKKEKISIGGSLQDGDTFLYFEEIEGYDRVEGEYDGKETLRFLIHFTKETGKQDLFLPQTVFSRFQDALKKGEVDSSIVGIRTTRQGEGLKTRYTSVFVKKEARG